MPNESKQSRKYSELIGRSIAEVMTEAIANDDRENPWTATLFAIKLDDGSYLDFRVVEDGFYEPVVELIHTKHSYPAGASRIVIRKKTNA